MGNTVRFHNFFLVALAGLLAAGCESLEGPPAVGDEVPYFEVTSLATNETVTPATFSGEVMLINLWATWCGPCRFETPYLQSIHEEYADRGLRVVGISVDNAGALDVVKGFLADNRVTYVQLLDPDMMSTEVFSAIGLPASFIVGKDGTLQWIRYGPILEGDPDFLRALEEALS